MTDDRKRETLSEIDSGLWGTVRIDPDKYSPQSNTNQLDRTKFAIAGLLHLLVHHHQFYYILAATLAVLVLAGWLQVSSMLWAVLVINIGQLWLAEIFNSSLEAVTDLATEGEIRSLAKVAKDVAATGAFVASSTFLIVNAIVFVPLLLNLSAG